MFDLPEAKRYTYLEALAIFLNANYALKRSSR